MAQRYKFTTYTRYKRDKGRARRALLKTMKAYGQKWGMIDLVVIVAAHINDVWGVRK